MIALNLTTTNKAHEILKEYLENNVSEVLADKINNGVKIVKDGKPVINRKDLTTFMEYAADEARKNAQETDKCARYACYGEDVVFDWAVHYFEEDSIEGKLYNEDGTECCRTAGIQKHAVKAVSAPKPQMSMFDCGGQPQTAAVETVDTADDDEPDEAFTDESDIDDTAAPDDNEPDEAPQGLTQRELFSIGGNKYIDADGVVYSGGDDRSKEEIQAKEAVPSVLCEIAGCAVKVR